jgi:hypothetical protein
MRCLIPLAVGLLIVSGDQASWAQTAGPHMFIAGGAGSLHARTISVIDLSTHRTVAVLATPVPESRTIDGMAVINKTGARVFLADRMRDRIHVLNLTTPDTPLSQFDTPAPGALALAPDDSTLYAVGPAGVQAIDAADLRQLWSVALRARPVAMAVTATGAIVTAYATGTQLDLIDPATRTVQAGIDIGGAAATMHLDAAGSKAAVVLASGAQVVVVDLAGRIVLRRLTLASTPGAVAIGANGSDLFAGVGTEVIRIAGEAGAATVVRRYYRALGLHVRGDGLPLLGVNDLGAAFDTIDVVTGRTAGTPQWVGSGTGLSAFSQALPVAVSRAAGPVGCLAADSGLICGETLCGNVWDCGAAPKCDPFSNCSANFFVCAEDDALGFRTCQFRGYCPGCKASDDGRVP